MLRDRNWWRFLCSQPYTTRQSVLQVRAYHRPIFLPWLWLPFQQQTIADLLGDRGTCVTMRHVCVCVCVCVCVDSCGCEINAYSYENERWVSFYAIRHSFEDIPEMTDSAIRCINHVDVIQQYTTESRQLIDVCQVSDSSQATVHLTVFIDAPGKLQKYKKKRSVFCGPQRQHYAPVSYTHLTLPTIYSV